MRRGIPVACSDLAVLREVGGDVAHYFPLGDAEATAGAIVRAMADRSAGPDGRQRASAFSWTAAAQGTHAVYERALCTSD